MRRWLPLAFGLINWCPKSDDDRCNNDNDCDEDQGFRCQILQDPVTGKEKGECVLGGDPDLASRS
jgi:hypothetical protein